MNFKAFAAALVTMSFLATPANALSITNEVEVAYSFSVLEKTCRMMPLNWLLARA